MIRISLRGISLSFILLCAVLIFPKTIFASEDDELQRPDIIISELMVYGSSVSSSDEWIELKNLTDKIIDVKNYTIFDEIKAGTMVTIEEGQIAPGGYFLISNNSKDHEFKNGESVLNIDPDVIDSNVSLSNSKFQISLRNGEGDIIDAVGDGGKPFLSDRRDEFYSIERVGSASGVLGQNWVKSSAQENLDQGVPDMATPANSGRPVIEDLQTSSQVYFLNRRMSYRVTYSVTNYDKLSISVSDGESEKKIDLSEEGEIHIREGFCPILKFNFISPSGLYVERDIELQCLETSNNVKINEVLSHPKRDWNNDKKADSYDEWIEIINEGEDISLEGWWLADKKGKKYQINDLRLSKGGYKVLYKNETKISINDNGDQIFLYDPSGKIISRVTVPDSSKFIDCSYSKFDNKWSWSSKPTPNQKNLIKPLVVNKNKKKKTINQEKMKEVDLVDRESSPTSTTVPEPEIIKVEKIERHITTRKITKVKLALADSSIIPNNSIRADFGKKILGVSDNRDKRTSNYLFYMVYFTG